MKGTEIFKDVSQLTDENCEQVLPYDVENRSPYFADLRDCVEVLQKKYKDVVTGFWYISEPAGDGGTQFVFRTVDDVEDVYLLHHIHGDILRFTGHEMLYHITDDSIEGLRSIPISYWVKEGSVYALYDTERGIS